MNRGGGVHTVPGGAQGGWVVRLNGKFAVRYPTKRVAVYIGRGFARMFKVEHSIHNKKRGQIKVKNSYGRDRHPPKG